MNRHVDELKFRRQLVHALGIGDWRVTKLQIAVDADKPTVVTLERFLDQAHGDALVRVLEEYTLTPKTPRLVPRYSLPDDVPPPPGMSRAEFAAWSAEWLGFVEAA